MNSLTDLYSYVNGDWMKSHEIPADRGVDGTFHALRDQAEAQVHALLQEDSGRGGAVYRSFMDVNNVNAAGVGVLHDDLQLLDVNSAEELARALGQLDRVGVGAPLGFWVEKDSQGTDAVPYLVQSGLGLPDEAYYREDAHAETLAAYADHVERMLSYAPSLPVTPREAAPRVVALEKKLAAAHWDVVASRDAMRTYNPTTVAELPELVQVMLAGAGLTEGLTEGRVINMMPSYTDALGQLLGENLEDWILWGYWHVLRARAGVLPEEVGEANFDFYGRRLSGATEQRDRWKRGVALAESLVGHDIGKAYVRAHFSPEAKEDMLRLVDYLLAAYDERIRALDWMTEDAKTRALEKLSQFKAKIGYPETGRSYEGLELHDEGSFLVDNVRAAAAFNHDYELSKVGKPADRDEWVTTPQTVNAFYNPVVNDITFPAAILQPPFFGLDADAAENFGAIGAVIGHEIGHGFDDQGSQYDGHGNLEPWWDDASREAFTERTNALVGQFDGLVPSVLEGTESSGVNGKFTLGENIGDLGGLGIAVVAYRNWLKDHDQTGQETAPFGELDGEYTGYQRLFLSWARVWRTAIRPEMATQYLAIDPHSPAEFRCNVIASNIDEFYAAFPTAEDGPMYRAPEERVTIW